MKRFILLFFCFTLFVSFLAAQEEKEELVTKVYHLDPPRWTQVISTLPGPNQSGVGDPFGDPFGGGGGVKQSVDVPWAKKTATQDDAKAFFAKLYHLEFPEGSWIKFDTARYMIIMHNTEQQHERLRLFLPLPKNITISLREVEFEAPVLEAAEKANEGLLSDEQLFALWTEGKGKTVNRQSVTTITGVNSIIELVDEIIQPTEMTVTTNGVSRVAYGGLETREVGYILNVTPTVSADEQTINLVLLPENATYEGEREDHPEALQPLTATFASFNLTTSMVLANNRTAVVGQSTDRKTGNHRVLFVKAQIKNTDGTLRKKPDYSVFIPKEK